MNRNNKIVYFRRAFAEFQLLTTRSRRHKSDRHRDMLFVCCVACKVNDDQQKRRLFRRRLSERIRLHTKWTQQDLSLFEWRVCESFTCAACTLRNTTSSADFDSLHWDSRVSVQTFLMMTTAVCVANSPPVIAQPFGTSTMANCFIGGRSSNGVINEYYMHAQCDVDDDAFGILRHCFIGPHVEPAFFAYTHVARVWLWPAGGRIATDCRKGAERLAVSHALLGQSWHILWATTWIA